MKRIRQTAEQILKELHESAISAPVLLYASFARAVRPA